ncbi:hypothetical protein [uncultured Tolumonas sp.]|uniref:hypothetical protein n=1 Tax=uncultured Tolumonas sp. TaxID=263765 RepID=UPI002931B9F9|nr:hypothetical protein [uncultured Tolumonas sp.]
MKTFNTSAFFLFLLCSFFAYSSETIQELKKEYYNSTEYPKYDQKPSPDNINVEQHDINGDGINEVALYHMNDCGSSGCYASVYKQSPTGYCFIGSTRIDEFLKIKNKKRDYSCLSKSVNSITITSDGSLLDESTPKNIEPPKNPFAIDTYQQNLFTYINITSKIDDIQIKNLKINRGNCQLHPGQVLTMPNTLKFGQTFPAVVLNCPRLLEIFISTNYGDYTYNVE